MHDRKRSKLDKVWAQIRGDAQDVLNCCLLFFAFSTRSPFQEPETVGPFVLADLYRHNGLEMHELRMRRSPHPD